MRHAVQSPINHPTGEGEAEDGTAAAPFIASMLADLSVLARQNNLDTLGYLLDMARLEAENVSSNGRRR